MPVSEWQTRRHDDRIATDADQAEVVAVRYGSCNLEAGIFDDRIADALDDYEVEDPKGEVPRWASEDSKVESATSAVGLEVTRRGNLLGDRYPFILEGSRIAYRRTQTLVYELCLAISRARSLSQGDYARLPIAFERLVRDVLICFLGPGAQGFRTGWPGDAREGRPARFKELIGRVAELTGEWHWAPEHGLPDDPPPTDVKDEGLDVVVWKAIPDSRAGKLFLLGQCACGGAYETKFHDIDASFAKLKKWINPMSWAAPVRVFSTPRHIANEKHFEQVNKQAGFTLDRVRLTLLAEQDQHRDFIRMKMIDDYAELIALVIPDFPTGQPARQPRLQTEAAEPHSQSRGIVAVPSTDRMHQVLGTLEAQRIRGSCIAAFFQRG